MRDEVPYGAATLVERCEERPEQGLTVIGATILVGAAEPQGHRHRDRRRAAARDRHAGPQGARAAARHAGLPRAVRARRAGLGGQSTAARGARALGHGGTSRSDASRPAGGRDRRAARTSGSRRSSTASCGRIARSSTTRRASRATASWRGPSTRAGRSCASTRAASSRTRRATRAALAAQVRAQALAAVAEADCVVCVLDGAAGPRAGRPRHDPPAVASRQARVLRRQQDRYGRARAARGGVLRRRHGSSLRRSRRPTAAACARCSTPWWRGFPACAAASDEAAGTRLALLGRPNVGKSSLLNRLLGTEHALVAPEAGTTRDAVDTPVRIDGRPFVLIDTAGIRRRGRGTDALERHGAVRALGMIERSDLVLFVLDATDGMTDQDARLVGRAWEAGRGVILLANKWDLTSGPQRDVRTFRRALQAGRPGFAALPLLCVSARTGEGLEGLFGVLADRSSVATARRMRDAGAEPRAPRGRRGARAAQPGGPAGPPLLRHADAPARRPEVTVFASAPARVSRGVHALPAHALREAFGLVGVPLRVRFRPRRDGDRAHDACAVAARELDVVRSRSPQALELGVVDLARCASPDFRGRASGAGSPCPGVTSAPAPTRLSAPITAPSSTIAPIPIRQPSSTVQPWRIALWPTVTPSPTIVGEAAADRRGSSRCPARCCARRCGRGARRRARRCGTRGSSRGR